MNVTIHQGYLPGCIGRIVTLHADYYSRHAQFGVAFEAKVARGLGDFCEAFVEDRDGLWLAIVDNVVEGCIAIDGSHAGAEGAHLRWFIASDKLRGQGAGAKLIGAAMDFCRDRGYSRAYLWTFEGLAAAQHLYRKAGFALVHQARGTRWGQEVEEQRWEWGEAPAGKSPEPEAFDADFFRRLERARTAALVARDVGAARALHAPHYQLVTPSGVSFTRERYLGMIASGDLAYVRWEAGEMEVRVCDSMAVVRYVATLELDAGGGKGTPFQCWHTDSYERVDGSWMAVWSQATAIKPRD